MYKEYFGFDRYPFEPLPDSNHIYWTTEHRRGFETFGVGVERNAPIAILTGGAGTGKTTLITRYFQEASGKSTIGRLSTFPSAGAGLLHRTLTAFNQNPDCSSEAILLARLQDCLTDEFASGRSSVLIIDEAQEASDADFNDLGLLTNINDRADVQLMIALVGRPKLRQRLARPEFRSIAQRIGADFNLAAMSNSDAAGYVRHRLISAGGSENLFNSAALDEVYAATAGVPRAINTLCDRCLEVAFERRQKRISVRDVRAIASDLRTQGELAAPAAVHATQPERSSSTIAPATSIPEQPSGAAGLAGVAEEGGDATFVGASADAAGSRGASDWDGSAHSSLAGDAHDASQSDDRWLDPPTLMLAADEATTKPAKNPRSMKRAAPIAAIAASVGAVVVAYEQFDGEVWLDQLDVSAGPAVISEDREDLADDQTASLAPTQLEFAPADVFRSFASTDDGGFTRASFPPESELVGASMPPATSNALEPVALPAAFALIADRDAGVPGASADIGFSEPASAAASRTPMLAMGAATGFLEALDMEMRFAAPAASFDTRGAHLSPAIMRFGDSGLSAQVQDERSIDAMLGGLGADAPAFYTVQAAVAISHTSRLSADPKLDPKDFMFDEQLHVQVLLGVAQAEPPMLHDAGDDQLTASWIGAPPGLTRYTSVSAEFPSSADENVRAALAAVPDAPGLLGQYDRSVSADPSEPISEVATIASLDSAFTRVDSDQTSIAVAALNASADPAGRSASSTRSIAPATTPEFVLHLRSDEYRSLRNLFAMLWEDRPAPTPVETAAPERSATYFRTAVDIGMDDPTGAMINFARAAISGHKRAAYYLGQIYETGDGVPVNPSLARAWYQAVGSDERNAQRRLADLAAPRFEGRVEPPHLLLAERDDTTIAEFVWTSAQGADPSFYVIEIAAASGEGAIASYRSNVSAVRLPLPGAAKFWRVLAVDHAKSRYAASEWQEISGGAQSIAETTPQSSTDATLPIMLVAHPDQPDTDLAESLSAASGWPGVRLQTVAVDRSELVGNGVYYFYDEDREAAEAVVEALFPNAVTSVLKVSFAQPHEAPAPGEILVTLTGS